MELPPATQKRVLSGAVRNKRSSVTAAGRHHRPFIGSSHHLANSTQPIGPSLKMFLSSERITFTRHSLCDCQVNADAVWHRMDTQGRQTPLCPRSPRPAPPPPPRPALLQNPHEGPAQRARGWWARRAARWGRVGSSVGVRTWDMHRPRGHPG